MRGAAFILLLALSWQSHCYSSLVTFTLIKDTFNINNICSLSERSAKATTLFAQTPNYQSALASIKKAHSTSHKEFVISFGKDSIGNVMTSTISTGNINNGYIPGITNRFADVHIHTNEQPPSSGDLYGFIDQAVANPDYIRYIITPKGQAYAFVLMNKKEALRFNTSYPRRPGIQRVHTDSTLTIYQPTFPQQLVDEFNQLKAWEEATPEIALVTLLKKYKAGIALLKQNPNGIYTALDVSEKTDNNRNKIRLLSPCPTENNKP